MNDTSFAVLDGLFEKQRAAFAVDSMPDLATRLDRLGRLETALVSGRIRLQESMAADFGSHHPIVTDLFETGGVLGRVRYVMANLEAWMAPSHRDLSPAVHGGSSAHVIRQPKGVMGNIGPWNFPVECALVMVADMLGAGNRVMVKASEFAPATGAAIAELVAKHFPPEELVVVNGGLALSEHFASLPWDHLTYTGGGRAARSIMAAAAANLTPLTLELGGKNPALFTETGMEAALVERFLYFRIFKGGQVCTAPDYALVPRTRMAEWIDKAKAAWTGMYPHYVGHADATGAINQHHYDRILQWLDEARAAGVEVISLNGDEPDPLTRQIPLYAVIDPPAHLKVAQEEVFGPIIAVVPYDGLADGIASINRRDRPLAAYVVTRENAEADRFARDVIAGGIGVNVFGFQGADPSLPFGGIGASGMGCHSGFEGFLSYTHAKSVFNCADDNALMLALKGPYGAMAHAFADAVFPAPGG